MVANKQPIAVDIVRISQLTVNAVWHMFGYHVILGKVPVEALTIELTTQFTWIIVLLAANRIAFNRGVRRYGAFGG